MCAYKVVSVELQPVLYQVHTSAVDNKDKDTNTINTSNSEKRGIVIHAIKSAST